MAHKKKVDWRGIPRWARSSFPNGPVGPEQTDWGGEDEDLFTPEEWADPVLRDEIEQVIAESKASWARSHRGWFARQRRELRAARLRELQTKRGAHMTRWQTPEERRAMYRRAKARAKAAGTTWIDWDALDAHEPSKLDLAEYLWLAGHPEEAGKLREEYWAEQEAEEEAEAISRHERRSAAAKKAARTRKEHRAERAAAVAAAAAILQDARRG
jgi:hypothetical protein